MSKSVFGAGGGLAGSRFNTRGPRAHASLKARANAALDALTTPGHRTRYFDGVPVNDLLTIVESAGFDIDPDERGMIVCGREGKATVPLQVGGVAVNHMLVFTWYKMDATGRYEVGAYVS